MVVMSIFCIRAKWLRYVPKVLYFILGSLKMQKQSSPTSPVSYLSTRVHGHASSQSLSGSRKLAFFTTLWHTLTRKGGQCQYSALTYRPVLIVIFRKAEVGWNTIQLRGTESGFPTSWMCSTRVLYRRWSVAPSLLVTF